jgi:outer membrane protein TolC
MPADTLDLQLEAVSDSMLLNNPMLGMLRYEQESFDSRRKMVTKMSYPMIGLGLNYSVINKNDMSTSEMNGKDMVMPMVAMTLPIYRKKYRAMQAETDLLKAATAQNYAATANDLKTEYFRAVQLYQDAKRRVTLYANQSMLAGKSLDIMIKSFAASGSGLTDILRIRQQTLDYDYKKVEAVADFNTAIAWLKRIMAFQQIQ